MGNGHTWGPKDTDFKSPLARVKAKGASSGSVEEWIKEAYAFVIWVPLSIYVAISLFSGVASSYSNMSAWLSNAITVFLLFSAILASVLHGFETLTVIKDYVHNHFLEVILVWLLKMISLGIIIFSGICILMIAL